MPSLRTPARAIRAAVSSVAALAPYAARISAVPRIGLATVRGRSMEPTLHEGDRLLIVWGLPPVTGRLALVRLPEGSSGARPLAVKRVTGTDPADRRLWWVERDNPREGVDSWQVGGIPAADVPALVVTRLPHLPRLPLSPSLRRSLRRIRRGRLGASER